MVGILRLCTAAAGLLLSGAALAAPTAESSSPGKYSWEDLAISAPADGRYLYRTKSREPFLWIADTNWELFKRLNHSDIDLYLADRAAKGFNVIQAVILSHYNATTSGNFFGDKAIENSDPTQPNEAYFRFVDWVIDRAASEYGILIALWPSWSHYVNSGWYGTLAPPRVFDDDSAEWFGRYLGKRYPGLPKILGGDTNGFWADNVPQAREAWREDPTSDPQSFLHPIQDTRHIWAAMMKGFKEEEAKLGYDAWVTWHPTSPWIADPPTPLPFAHNYINETSHPGLGPLTISAVQSGHENPDPDGIDANYTVLRPWDSCKNYESITLMRSQFPGPVLDLENHYEGAHDSFDPAKPLWNSSHVRHGYYPALFSGAAGVAYGSLPVQQSYENKSLVASPAHWVEPQLGLGEGIGWHEAIHWDGAFQTGLVGKVFSGLRSKEEWDGLRPWRDGGVLGGVDGSGEDVLAYERNRYMAAMGTVGWYWVYSGYGDAFQVDLGKVAAGWGDQGTVVGGSSRSKYTAEWFDPRTGHVTPVFGGEGKWGEKEKTRLMLGKQVFTPPTRGGVDHDWLLVVKSAKSVV